MIFPQCRICCLGKISSPPSQTRWRKTVLSRRQLQSQKGASEGRKQPPFLARRKGKEVSLFCRGGPPAKYGGRQGKSFFLYNSQPCQNREGDFSRGRQFTNSHRQGQKPLYHEPRLPPDSRNPLRGSSETSEFLVKKHPGRLRNGNGFGQRESQRPVGGCLAHIASNWEKISNNPWIQETISGSRLEFRCTPQQGSRPGRMHLDAEKFQVLSQEVENLAAKEAIQPVPDDGGLYQSDISCSKVRWFMAASDKLEITEQVCGYSPFQNGINQDSKRVIAEGRLARLERRIFHCPHHSSQQNYLRFQWQSQTWEFKVLPFGLSSAPYTSKLMKPVVSTLRKLGIKSILYLDDMLIMARSKEEARKYLATAMELLVALGFIVNLKKSTLTLTQELEFLGFLLSSYNMTIGLPTHKLHTLKKMAR